MSIGANIVKLAENEGAWPPLNRMLGGQGNWSDNLLIKALALGGFGAAGGVIGAPVGAAIGAPLGFGAGIARKRPGAGAVRGLVSGALTGGGIGAGALMGQSAADMFGGSPTTQALATLAGAATGGVSGWATGRSLMGPPGDDRKKQAFDERGAFRVPHPVSPDAAWANMPDELRERIMRSFMPMYSAVQQRHGMAALLGGGLLAGGAGLGILGSRALRRPNMQISWGKDEEKQEKQAQQPLMAAGGNPLDWRSGKNRITPHSAAKKLQAGPQLGSPAGKPTGQHSAAWALQQAGPQGRALPPVEQWPQGVQPPMGVRWSRVGLPTEQDDPSLYEYKPPVPGGRPPWEPREMPKPVTSMRPSTGAVWPQRAFKDTLTRPPVLGFPPSTGAIKKQGHLKQAQQPMVTVDPDVMNTMFPQFEGRLPDVVPRTMEAYYAGLGSDEQQRFNASMTSLASTLRTRRELANIRDTSWIQGTTQPTQTYNTPTWGTTGHRIPQPTLPTFKQDGLTYTSPSAYGVRISPPGPGLAAMKQPPDHPTLSLGPQRATQGAGSVAGKAPAPPKPPQPLAKSGAVKQAQEPGSYGMPGFGMYTRNPITERRQEFSPEEDLAISEGQSRWLPQIFQSRATPLPNMMASPGKQSLLAGLGGGLAGGVGGAALGGGPLGIAGGAAGLGGLAALIRYFEQNRRNEDLTELMRRLPQGATKRDYLSDPTTAAEGASHPYGDLLPFGGSYSRDGFASPMLAAAILANQRRGT